MSQNIFNLYSAEAFSQHPLALWSLDDDFSFVSLISASPSYTVSNGEITTVSNPPTEKPQETVGVADISLELDSFTGYGDSSRVSTQSFSIPDDIDSNKPTACVSAFVYPYDTDISELEIGFEYENPLFVAIGNNSASISGIFPPVFTDAPSNLMALSTDAITWTQGTLPESLTWYTISYGNNLFVVSARGAPGTIANRLCVSTNGITWTLFDGAFAGWDLIYKNNIFLGVVGGSSGVGSSDSRPFRSTDGLTWTRPNTTFAPFASTWSNAAYGNNNFVILSGQFSTNHAIYSNDNAETWQATTLPTTSGWETVSYGNDIFVALAYPSGGVSPAAISTNGITWTASTAPQGSWRSIAYGNETFVAITGGTLSSVSTNGITWTLTSLPNSSPFWRSVDYLKNVFVVQGNDTNIILTSTDGVIWSQNTLPRTAFWRDTAYGDVYNSGDSSVYKNLELNSWTKIEHTIDLPELNTDMTPFINVKHYGSEKTYSLYNLAVGQWSEQYNHKTDGIVPTEISLISSSAEIIQSIGSPVSSSPSLYKVVIADAYGLSDKDQGYYLVENNKMLATNSNLPMVYGSGDITEIYASDNSAPSLIFPGKGFMHSNGKYKNLTAEFWLKIFPKNASPTKIFGPVASKDGLYVNKEFLTLRIGPYEKSYFINKWYRPMLVDIRYTETYISVLVNGDLVIEQKLISNNVIFPEPTSFNNDWIAFYSNSEIEKFQIDCLAIYPYIVNQELAKKKFIYAQGVGPANEITTKFGASSFPIDFSFAKYSANLIYPDMTNWYAGFYSNINATSQYISLPEYSSPEIKYFGNDLSTFNFSRKKISWQSIKERTWSQWSSRLWREISSTRESEPLFDNYDLQRDREDNFYLKLKPNSSYDNIYGSIIFNSLSPLIDKTSSIFGVFSLNTAEIIEADPEKEIIIMHFLNQQTNNIFKIVYDSLSSEIQYLYNNTKIKSFSFTPGDNDTYFSVGIDIEQISSSFATILRKFFVNEQNIIFSLGGYQDNQFTGKIYKTTFNNNFFTQKDLTDYFDDGIISLSNSANISESHPLFSYDGNYTLFFKKTNDSIMMDIASTGYWEDSIPLSTLGTYVLDKNRNKLYDCDFIQFNIDYPDSIIAQDNFDVDNNVKAYVSLQNFEDVGDVSYSNYSIVKNLNEKRYVNFEDIESNIDITKFRVVDGTIIFAPKSIIDFNSAFITVHMELKSPGINTNNIKIQRMSLASLAYDESFLYGINTSQGNKVYPFTRQGSSYINKAKNPFLIYKDSTPYLYLTGDSGIQSIPYPDIEESASETFRRGISVPINQGRKEDYSLYGISMWCAYNKDKEFLQKEKVFSLSYQTERYVIYVEPEVDNKRAKLVAYKEYFGEELETSEIIFYQDGVKKIPYLNPLSWSFITIRFENTPDISSIIGQFEIYPGIIFNNLSIYEQDIDKLVDDIFESHLGLSNIVSDDSSTLSFNFDQVNLFNGIRWTTFDGKPI